MSEAQKRRLTITESMHGLSLTAARHRLREAMKEKPLPRYDPYNPKSINSNDPRYKALKEAWDVFEKGPASDEDMALVEWYALNANWRMGIQLYVRWKAKRALQSGERIEINSDLLDTFAFDENGRRSCSLSVQELDELRPPGYEDLLRRWLDESVRALRPDTEPIVALSKTEFDVSLPIGRVVIISWALLRTGRPEDFEAVRRTIGHVLRLYESHKDASAMRNRIGLRLHLANDVLAGNENVPIGGERIPADWFNVPPLGAKSDVTPAEISARKYTLWCGVAALMILLTVGCRRYLSSRKKTANKT